MLKYTKECVACGAPDAQHIEVPIYSLVNKRNPLTGAEEPRDEGDIIAFYAVCKHCGHRFPPIRETQEELFNSFEQ